MRLGPVIGWQAVLHVVAPVSALLASVLREDERAEPSEPGIQQLPAHRQKLSSCPFLPLDDFPTILAGATKALESSVEQARFGQFRFDPEVTSARRALHVVTPFHLGKPSPQVFDVTSIKQSVKCGDSGRASNEELNSTRVARYVRLALLGNPHLTRVRTNRARKHPFSIENCHLRTSDSASFDSPNFGYEKSMAVSRDGSEDESTVKPKRRATFRINRYGLTETSRKIRDRSPGFPA
jgi:hypothetical protein